MNPSMQKKSRNALIATIAIVVLLLLMAGAAWLVVRHGRSQAMANAGGYPGSVGRGGGGGPRGRVTAVTPTSITINSRRAGAHTYTVTAATTFTLDGKPIAASALKAGQGARITSADGKTATVVAVRTRRPGGFGGRGGGGGYPGGAGGGRRGGSPGGGYPGTSRG
jgi:hypothetical protein